MKGNYSIKPLLFINTLLFASGLHASIEQPHFGVVAVPPTSNILKVLSNGISTVQYQVTNNTEVTRTLTYVPMTGISQTEPSAANCTNPFTLMAGQSCLLNLQLNGSTLPKKTVGGPVVCNTVGPDNNNPDFTFCSHACGVNELFVKVTSQNHRF